MAQEAVTRLHRRVPHDVAIDTRVVYLHLRRETPTSNGCQQHMVERATESTDFNHLYSTISSRRHEQEHAQIGH